MGDLEQYLPKESPIVEAIYARYKKTGWAAPARGYLGASIIGHKCSRFLWYTFRDCTKEDFPGRIYRLFETGDLEEIRMVKDLRDIGCFVHDIDPNTGRQFEVFAIGDHLSGHMDGCGYYIPTAEKTWHVLEFKTFKAKLFAILVKKGVRVSNPKHFAQMQIYMHLTGMKRALYLAKNKDTDELHTERVHYDKAFAESLMAKARQIIFAKEPPSRITERPDWYECKFCSAYDLCWASGSVALPVPAITCRQCCHATPTEDGHARWICEKHGRGLCSKDQKMACDDHLILPGLLSFAQPVGYTAEAGSHECIHFQNTNGDIWRHGQTEGHFCSRELRNIPIQALSSEMLTSAKEIFGAEATGSFTDDILSRYPKEDSELVYRGKVDGLEGAWEKKFDCKLVDSEIIATVDTGDYRAVEFIGGRVAVIHLHRSLHPAEIWKGKE